MSREAPEARRLRDRIVGALAVPGWPARAIDRLAALALRFSLGLRLGDPLWRGGTSPESYRGGLVRAFGEPGWPLEELREFARALVDEGARGAAPAAAAGALLSLMRELQAEGAAR